MNYRNSRHTATMTGIAALLLLCASVLPAQVHDSQARDFIVRYSEGTVELQRAGSWIAVYPGDVVPAHGTLRMGAAAYAEISDGRATLRLAQAGVYQMSNLLGARSAPARQTITSMIGDRFRRLSDRPAPADPVVGGARATEVPGDVGIDWVGGEGVPDLIAAGRTALVAGDIDAAFNLFDEAMLYATDSERPEAAFYLGYALFLSGEPRGALSWLRTYRPDPATDYYHEHVITLAQTKLELAMGLDAVALLTGYTGSAAGARESELLPTAHLLLGLGHRINGDGAAAQRELQHVQTRFPGSTAAAAAAGALGE